MERIDRLLGCYKAIVWHISMIEQRRPILGEMIAVASEKYDPSKLVEGTKLIYKEHEKIDVDAIKSSFALNQNEILRREEQSIPLERMRRDDDNCNTLVKLSRSFQTAILRSIEGSAEKGESEAADRVRMALMNNEAKEEKRARSSEFARADVMIERAIQIAEISNELEENLFVLPNRFLPEDVNTLLKDVNTDDVEEETERALERERKRKGIFSLNPLKSRTSFLKKMS